MADISGDAFLDFFASPSLSNGAGSPFNSAFTANGAFATSQQPVAAADDDDWGEFMGPPPDLAPSNGFTSRSASIGFDPFGAEPKSDLIGSDSKAVVFEKPRGPLPLSLFGFEEEGEGGEDETGGSVVDLPANGSDVSSLHRKSPSDLNLGAGEILSNLYAQISQIKHQSVLDSDTNGLDSVSKAETYQNGANEGSDDEDDWEFHGAFSGDGVGEGNFKGGFEVSESKGESAKVINQDQKAGQDASEFVVNNVESMNSPYQFADLFTSQNVVSNKNSEVNVGTDFKTNSFFPDAFMSFPLPNGVENGNANVTHPTPENVDDDFDDFGEFMDAGPEPVSKYQEHYSTHEASADAHVQDGNFADDSTRPESQRQPFPESVFSNGVVEYNEGQQSITGEATFAPRNGSTTLHSEKSIQDIISNLYPQDQHVPSVDSDEKPAENGSCTIQKTLDASSVNSWSYSDKSWDFKDEVVVKEKSNDVGQKESIKVQDLQIFVDFFARLQDKLHFLASCLLENAENSDAQEAHKSLQDDMGSEGHLEKSMAINGCLSEFIDVLRGPTFQIIESEYCLSTKLPLAEKDWKMAIKLLKETRLILKILESGSDDDQSAYISTWYNIVNVCAEELRYGASIWKQAVQNNLQIQILSDHRGQRHIHALGEIYRLVQLLGLSAKVYKPWMLLNKGDQLNLFLVLDECSALWSSSGLEEAFWNLLGSVDSESGQSVEALLESIQHIQEIDVLSVQDCAFLQRRFICHLSLLPEQMLPELKLVSWNGLRCFLKVANCWANLISHESPCLPQLKVG